MNHGKVIIKEAKPVKGKKRYIVIVQSPNGKVLMTSETLNTLASAFKNRVAANRVFEFGKWILNEKL